MHNGQDDCESEGVDDRSMDEVSVTNQNQNDHGTSDHEQSVHSANSEGASSNHEMPQAPHSDDGNEELHQESSDALADFFKLLPYLYLIQRNSNSSIASSLGIGIGGAVDHERQSPPFDLRKMFDAQSVKSVPQLEAFRSQLPINPLRYLQQLMPTNTILTNGQDDSNDNLLQTSDDGENGLDVLSDHDEPLDLTQKSKNVVVGGRTLLKTRDDKLIRTNNTRAERGYTIQDLEAALHDIKSGKLGTRRAAVLYGIPRSTLRNKVYKMGKTVSKSPENYFTSEKAGGDGDAECEFGLLKGNACRIPYNSYNTQNEKRMINNNLRYEENDESCEMTDFPSERRNDREKVSIGSSCISPLRIDTSIDGGRNGEQHNGVSDRNQMLGFKGYGQRGSIIGSSSSSLPLHNFTCMQAPSTSYDNYNESTLGKKSRPKRGKYRNYDREALAKAVQAVQNGQMSVHRAGSYFGVPHSTLEYKVKERHLLRQAKFKGKNTKSVINKSNNKDEVIGAGFSSATSLSPSTVAIDSNDSSNFHKTLGSTTDLQSSLVHYLKMSNNLSNKGRWNFSSIEMSSMGAGSGGGIRGTKIDEMDFESHENEPSTNNDNIPDKEINNVSPKIYDSSESLESDPSDLLDLTQKT